MRHVEMALVHGDVGPAVHQRILGSDEEAARWDFLPVFADLCEVVVMPHVTWS